MLRTWGWRCTLLTFFFSLRDRGMRDIFGGVERREKQCTLHSLEDIQGEEGGTGAIFLGPMCACRCIRRGGPGAQKGEYRVRTSPPNPQVKVQMDEIPGRVGRPSILVFWLGSLKSPLLLGPVRR